MAALLAVATRMRVLLKGGLTDQPTIHQGRQVGPGGGRVARRRSTAKAKIGPDEENISSVVTFGWRLEGCDGW
jgi:hypothetical protein